MSSDKALRESVKELGQWLAKLSHHGAFNPEIAAALERARNALRQSNENQVAQ